MKTELEVGRFSEITDDYKSSLLATSKLQNTKSEVTNEIIIILPDDALE